MSARVIGIVAAAVLAIGASTPVSAQSRSYDCTAGGGQFTQLTRESAGGNPAVSGQVQVKQLHSDDKLLPSATVRVSTKKDFVALQLTPTAPDSQNVLVRVRNGTGAQEEFEDLGTLTLNQPLSFRIDLLKGEIRVTAGNQSVTVQQLMRGDRTVALTCSTGAFEFENLTFG
jgi:hypothetical protein